MAVVAKESRDLHSYEKLRPLIDLAKFHQCSSCLDHFALREIAQLAVAKDLYPVNSDGSNSKGLEGMEMGGHIRNTAARDFLAITVLSVNDHCFRSRSGTNLSMASPIPFACLGQDYHHSTTKGLALQARPWQIGHELWQASTALDHPRLSLTLPLGVQPSVR